MGFCVCISPSDVAISTKITQDAPQCLQNACSTSGMDDLILTGSALTILQKKMRVFIQESFFIPSKVIQLDF